MSSRFISPRPSEEFWTRYRAQFLSQDIPDLYVDNSRFRRFVDSGNYLFIDGKIVLNSSSYITYTNGHLELCDNIQEDEPFYCLHYKQEIKRKRTSFHGLIRRPTGSLRSTHRFCARRMQRPSYGERNVIFKSVLEDAKKINSVNDVTLENIVAIVGTGNDPNENLAQAIVRFMKESGVTAEKLAELTGLDPKSIQRMRNYNHHPELESVIAVCVALHLDPYNGIYLVHLAGRELTNSDRDKIYRFILRFAYKETVYDCNRMLKRLGMKPLTNL